MTGVQTCALPICTLYTVSHTHIRETALRPSPGRRGNTQEKKWKDAQKGKLTGEQESTLKEAREKAAAARDGDLAKVTREERCV